MMNRHAAPAKRRATRTPRLAPPGAGASVVAWADLRQFTNLFDRFQEFVVLVSPNGHLVHANQSWRDALGFAAVEVPGLPLGATVSPIELGWWNRWLDPARPPGEVGAVHLTWRAKDGREVVVEGNLRICGDEGDSVRLVGVFHDLSRLTAAETALREAETVCHVIETRVPIGVFQTDSHGRLLRTNRRWRTIANLDHVPEPHGVWWQMVDPCDRERILTAWRATQTHGHDFRGEFRVNAGAGIERYARTTLVPHSAPDGSPAFYFGVAEDVTEQRRSEAELQEARSQLERRVRLRTAQLESANRELGRFAHVVAHDLKAPLRAVSNITEWLERDYRDRLDNEGRRFLGLLRQRVQHMHDLIEGILAYTRFRRVVEPEVDVNLQELVAELIALLAPPPNITFHLPPALPRVRGVPERLRHVFQNLLDNAVKFMDKPQGVVTITATRLPAAWQFGVADNGPGIAARHHARVFKMFEQLPARRGTGGTGIGLALVKRIVESRGGEVRLDSQEGAGASFTFTWPDTPPPPEAAPFEADPEI